MNTSAAIFVRAAVRVASRATSNRSIKSQRTRRYLTTASTSTPSSPSSTTPFDILFCGSDSFSIASLSALLAARDVYKSIAVITPREREVARRGKQVYVPPLRSFALKHGLNTYDVPSAGLSQLELPAPFCSSNSNAGPSSQHLLVTASFGHIIPTRMLNPFILALNVHPSLLPRYRGAAPVQWAIANGDTSTGVTVQTLVPRELGIDSGSILGAIGNIPIPPDATYTSLIPQLADIGGSLLVNVIRKLQRGEATMRAQDAGSVTRAPKTTLETVRACWNTQSATTLDRRSRAFAHHSPLWSHWRDIHVQLTAVRAISPNETLPIDNENLELQEPGMAVLDRKGGRVLVKCGADASGGEGWLEVTRVKAAGKKETAVRDWWNGLPKEARERRWIKFV